MNTKFLRWLGGATLALLVLAGCAKDETPEVPKANTEIGDSEYHGNLAPINLRATLAPEEMRAAIYDQTNKLENKDGAMPKLILDKKVPVAVYVRKKGDEAKTVSAAKLVGEVTEESGEYTIDIKGKIKLREADHNLSVGDWEVLCAIGGTTAGELPDENGEQLNNFKLLVYPTPEWTKTESGARNGKVVVTDKNANILTMMPWMTEWTDLKTSAKAPDTNLEVEGGYGKTYDLHFKPKGFLIKVKVLSDLAIDTKLWVEVNDDSQRFQWGGFFNMAEKYQHPNTREQAFRTGGNMGSTTLNAEVYKKGIGDQLEKYILKSGEVMEGNLYFWAMPKGPHNPPTEMTIGVTPMPYVTPENEMDYYIGSRMAKLNLKENAGDYRNANHPDYTGPMGSLSGRTALEARGEGHSKNLADPGRIPPIRANYRNTMKIQGYQHGKVYTFNAIASSSLQMTEVLLRTNQEDNWNADLPILGSYTYKSTWGGIELYNPTATPIDLSDYGIVRITSPESTIVPTFMVSHPKNLVMNPRSYSMDKALVQPLGMVRGEASYLFDGTPRPQNTTQIYDVLGTASSKIQPGQTVVLLDASYSRYQKHLPSEINQDGVHGIGIQLEKTYEKGYLQFAASLDNGEDKNKLQQSYFDDDAAVIGAGIMDNYFLVKKNKNGGGYSIVEGFGPRPIGQDTGGGTFWSVSYANLYSVKYAREGHSRTRLATYLKPMGGSGPYPFGDSSWGSAPSIETTDSKHDFVNRFLTFGSRRWLGPTEKSRENEWVNVPEFDEAKAKRKWTLPLRP